EKLVRALHCSMSRFYFFFSSRRRHTRFSRDWSSDVCSSDLQVTALLTLMSPLPVPLAPLLSVVTVILAPPRAVTRSLTLTLAVRSEERRVGKECRSRWSGGH